MRSPPPVHVLLAGALCALLLLAPRRVAAEDAGRRAVTLAAADGTRLAAVWHPAGERGGPAIVLLPGFRGTCADWEPAIEPLRTRGIAALVVAPRGHGRSADAEPAEVVRRVEDRDPAVFAQMHQDAIAAVAWAGTQGGCDPKRIVLGGAGTGGAIAVDAAARHPGKVAGVVWLTPGAGILGLDSAAHLKRLPATLPVMLVAHEDQAEGAQALRAVRAATRMAVLDARRPLDAGAERAWAHGTQMLGRIPLVEQTVASFAAVATGSEREDVVLDGIVTASGPDADPWARATEVGFPNRATKVYAFRVGRRILFGGTAPAGHRGLVFEVQTGGEASDAGGLTTVGPPQIVGADLDTSTVTWSFGGMGSMPSIPGLDLGPMFGRTYPVFRATRTDEGTTFEGEWFVPAFGESSPLVRLFIGTLPRPPEGPVGGGVRSYGGGTVDLPSR